jgi:hypothetical protein
VESLSNEQSDMRLGGVPGSGKASRKGIFVPKRRPEECDERQATQWLRLLATVSASQGLHRREMARHGTIGMNIYDLSARRERK